MTPVRRVRPELRVVFDTNALFTEAASDLLNSEVSSLIQQNRHHRDVTITWHLPEIVRHERQYQMSQRAIKFLQPIERLERLLGHNLNITKDILEQRVETVIQSQVTDLGITILDIDHQRVDWRRLVDCNN